VRRRRLQQRRVLGTTAHDAMHGDDVGGLNPICEHREISGYAPQAIGHVS